MWNRGETKNRRLCPNNSSVAYMSLLETNTKEKDHSFENYSHPSICTNFAIHGRAPNRFSALLLREFRMASRHVSHVRYVRTCPRCYYGNISRSFVFFRAPHLQKV